jgi:hypothetical protein
MGSALFLVTTFKTRKIRENVSPPRLSPPRRCKDAQWAQGFLRRPWPQAAHACLFTRLRASRSETSSAFRFSFSLPMPMEPLLTRRTCLPCLASSCSCFSQKWRNFTTENFTSQKRITCDHLRIVKNEPTSSTSPAIRERARVPSELETMDVPTLTTHLCASRRGAALQSWSEPEQGF